MGGGGSAPFGYGRKQEQGKYMHHGCQQQQDHRQNQTVGELAKVEKRRQHNLAGAPATAARTL
jgi:hypothetical protein